MCSEIAKPEKDHALHLSALFQGLVSDHKVKIDAHETMLIPGSRKTLPVNETFNPTQGTSGGRARPFKLWVVVGKRLFTSVPKATLRKTLNKSGRVQRVEFRRSLSGLQVQNRITQAFPQLKLDNVTFMKCIGLKMVTVEVKGGGYPTGNLLKSIASKESLYLVEVSKV